MQAISCPFCGVRSTVALDMPTTEAKSWTQHCPVCGKPWTVKVWIRRGLPELIVEPGAKVSKTAAPAAKPKRKKPVAKKAAPKKPAPKKSAPKRTAKPAKKARKK